MSIFTIFLILCACLVTILIVRVIIIEKIELEVSKDYYDLYVDKKKEMSYSNMLLMMPLTWTLKGFYPEIGEEL